MLNGAINTTINDGRFTIVSPPVAAVGARDDIVGLLHSHSANAGLLDAKERFGAPKCDEGTRTSMILGMKKFVQEGNASSAPALYWLHGPAGVGKSALAQSLSLELQAESDHAASFFFSRTSPGRGNGDELIVTLAYQLAKNFPALQPFMLKVAIANPDIFTASNEVQMQRLIVGPINKWRKKYNRGVKRWVDMIQGTKPHPRLVLVDGLDECNNPIVQTNLILCIASAVRQLITPIRFVITSRPESHILSTFELHSAFQGPNSVAVTKMNLGDDEDADEQITRYLSKQFAEIREKHPIRKFLPQDWPRPDQIEQLVSKSSKGFIYPATVLRYIKLDDNRPVECLDRILGLEEIPNTDKPYEPLDSLYRHIFESVPEANKRTIRNIFHFLMLPTALHGITKPTSFERRLGYPSGPCPAVIEELFKYPRGHVEHVLKDLLCIIEFFIDAGVQRIKVLHASLPDFLCDQSRSGHLCITKADVHAAIAAAYLSHSRLSNQLHYHDNHCSIFLKHLMNANLSHAILHESILRVDLLSCYREICNASTIGLHTILSGWYSETNPLQAELDIKSITFMVAYLMVLVIRGGSETYVEEQISTIKPYILQICPLVASAHTIHEKIIPSMTPKFHHWASTIYHKLTNYIFARKVDSPEKTVLREAIFELCFLMMVPLYEDGGNSSNLTHGNEKGEPSSGYAKGWIQGDPEYWAKIVSDTTKTT